MVVIDLLRATSTICQALAAGASEVVPFLEIDETLAAAEKEGGRRSCWAASGAGSGLRGSIWAIRRPSTRRKSWQAGGCSSPPPTARGRCIMRGRRRVVVLGSFLNLSAVVASLKDEPRVDILCAGTGGHPTGEDILVAGAIVNRLGALPGAKWHLNDAAAAARQEWQWLVAGS